MPFLAKEYVSEEKFQCLLQLIDLFTMHLSFEFSNEDLVKLEDLTDQFGTDYKRLWPRVNTLNLHGIVHYATQIRLFGPLRQHWCFRYESMHSVLTSLIPVIRSKKNVAKSLASRFIVKRNADIMKYGTTGKFLYQGDCVRGPEEICIEDLPVSLRTMEYFTSANTIVKVREFTSHSSVWREESVIVLSDGETVVFGRIHSV